LAQTRIVSFAGRVGFVLAAGIMAAISTNVSYWNWYGFPGVYTASYMFTQIVGFLLVGMLPRCSCQNALLLRRIANVSREVPALSDPFDHSQFRTLHQPAHRCV
jgi:hypothetical protein